MSPSTIGFLVLLTAVGCVTRGKHAATVADWRGQLSECTGARDRAVAELEGRLSAADTALRSARAGAADREAKLSAAVEASREEIAALRRQREAIERQIAQFQKLQEAFKKMISAGEIQLYRRRGRLMVALPSSVLFASGKADLSPAGQTALTKVSAVLGKLKRRRFVVAGHTDTVPIRTAEFPDNWSLSTERATVVTRFMIAGGVSPRMLAAAGYGQFDPLRRNNTRANRARNRRIEIILMPNIDELPALPE